MSNFLAIEWQEQFTFRWEMSTLY